MTKRSAVVAGGALPFARGAAWVRGVAAAGDPGRPGHGAGAIGGLLQLPGAVGLDPVVASAHPAEVLPHGRAAWELHGVVEIDPVSRAGAAGEPACAVSVAHFTVEPCWWVVGAGLGSGGDPT